VNASALATACLASAAVHLARPPRPRLLQLPANTTRPATRRGLLLRLRPVLAGSAGIGAWVFVGSPFGVAAGAVATAVCWAVLGRTEEPAVRRRRERLARELPSAVALLAACLGAGADVGSALRLVADGLGGPVAQELHTLAAGLALGADPAGVWQTLAGHPQLAPLGRAMLRAQRTGASAAAAIADLAADLAGQDRGRLEDAARRVGVRAAAPLGLCFLPAFLLLGIVPMAAGLFSTMGLFG
jgi:Flp pilus assembly protein TadB